MADSQRTDIVAEIDLRQCSRAMDNLPLLAGTPNAPVLIVEEDASVGAAMEMILAGEGFRSTVVHPGDAELLLDASCFSLVLSEYYSLSAEASEQTALSLLKAAGQVPVGCITSWSAIPPQIECQYAFRMMKPFEVTTLLGTVGQFAAVQIAGPAKADVINRYFRALSDRNWQELGSLCSESVRYHFPGTDELSGTVSGRDAFRAYAAEAFASFPNAHFKVPGISWLPHAAVARYQVSWDVVGNGFDVGDGAIYFRFLGDQIDTIGVRTEISKLRSDSIT
jgi:hypothetical protein